MTILTILTMLAISGGTFDLQRPHLVIGQGLVESGMNQYAVGKDKDKGAFQVIEKYWGKVPKDMASQAKQNERIVDTLLAENDGDLFTAICRYNGSGEQAVRYAALVRQKTIELCLMEV